MTSAAEASLPNQRHNSNNSHMSNVSTFSEEGYMSDDVDQIKQHDVMRNKNSLSLFVNCEYGVTKCNELDLIPSPFKEPIDEKNADSLHSNSEAVNFQRITPKRQTTDSLSNDNVVKRQRLNRKLHDESLHVVRDLFEKNSEPDPSSQRVTGSFTADIGDQVQNPNPEEKTISDVKIVIDTVNMANPSTVNMANPSPVDPTGLSSINSTVSSVDEPADKHVDASVDGPCEQMGDVMSESSDSDDSNDSDDDDIDRRSEDGEKDEEEDTIEQKVWVSQDLISLNSQNQRRNQLESGKLTTPLITTIDDIDYVAKCKFMKREFSSSSSTQKSSQHDTCEQLYCEWTFHSKKTAQQVEKEKQITAKKEKQKRLAAIPLSPGQHPCTRGTYFKPGQHLCEQTNPKGCCIFDDPSSNNDDDNDKALREFEQFLLRDKPRKNVTRPAAIHFARPVKIKIISKQLEGGFEHILYKCNNDYPEHFYLTSHGGETVQHSFKPINLDPRDSKCASQFSNPKSHSVNLQVAMATDNSQGSFANIPEQGSPLTGRLTLLSILQGR